MNTKTVLLLTFVLGLGSPLVAQNPSPASPTIVFAEENFPSSDSPAPDVSRLRTLLPEARTATADQLSAGLSDPATRLLVMPYGSAFPETAWDSIFSFLTRGGNLLALG
ncbi:MAG TPA: hypothetical protein VLC12_14515, partial [Terriglobales bacterium]|nr:hypothetical protein [Terriglobales bacterium]